MGEENNENNKMALGDLFGAGKVLPVDKLIDMFTNSFGRLFKSHFSKKDADAKAYELREMAKAQSDAMKILASGYKEASQITAGIGYKDDRMTIEAPKELPTVPQPKPIEFTDPSLEQRAIARIDYKEAKKQLNIESVMSIAFEQLKDEDPVADEPVNEDWATRFFSIVEDVSDEEMQTLWGRILAGEIKQPKSFSLRALELLRNLSKEEAEIFTEAASFAFCDLSSNFIYQVHGDKLFKYYNFNYSKILVLVEAGILHSGQPVNYGLKQYKTPSAHYFTLGETVICVKRLGNSPEITIPVYKFTKSGGELLKLITVNPPFNYIKDFGNFFKIYGATSQYGKVLENSNGLIQHGKLKDFGDEI